MSRQTSSGMIWSGRPDFGHPETVVNWRALPGRQSATGLLLCAFGVWLTPLLWPEGLALMQQFRGGHRAPGLGGALVALLGPALALYGLARVVGALSGNWLRLRFRSYALTKDTAFISLPLLGTRRYALDPEQKILLDEANRAVWFRASLHPGRPARYSDALRLIPSSPGNGMVGFENIADAPEVFRLMTALSGQGGPRSDINAGPGTA
ncbi:hypothetical protein HOY34_05495 [Xinfangfangia sp. D13-10-4-6]|uniref:hypothetical protein n=1 Tax=Pseudogemmobacter hezensis TaxID=2737662 RepID=UPI0015552EE5|nr:hypothetical protein [Pseudogemmobacter hezensis]NPD14657.1 hypothetical protein [Pseudogemmobacter hezensis]